MNFVKEEVARLTNRGKRQGTLQDALVEADVFIGVSAPGILTAEMVASMAEDGCICTVQIIPRFIPTKQRREAQRSSPRGSDYPNQINNVLAFPGIFRGAFDVRARDINDHMKIAAAYALAGLISEDELAPEYIIPKAFDPRVGKAVAEAVAKAAEKTGVARI